MDSDNKASSYCWWWDIESIPTSAGWLQNSLKDLDLKTNAILTFIQEDEESLVHGADTCCKKRKELIKKVEELRLFYRSVARKWVLESNTMAPRLSSSLSWNPFKRLRDLHSTSRKAKESDSSLESTVEDPETESASLNSNGELPSRKTCFLERGPENLKLKIPDEIVDNRGEVGNVLQLVGGITNKVDGIDLGDHGNEQVKKRDSHDRRSRVMRLMEENLKLQAELIKRNEEKREAIKALCSELHQTSEENRLLKNCLKRLGNQSQLSRVKSIFHVNFW